MNQRKKVVIDRKMWRCGGTHGHYEGRNDATYLLDPGNDMKCCVGFHCLQFGIDEKFISGQGEPWDVLSEHEDQLDQNAPKLIEACMIEPTDDEDLSNDERWDIVYRYSETHFSQDAIAINDDSSLSRGQREKKLKKLAAKHGFEWEFIGEYRYPESGE